MKYLALVATTIFLGCSDDAGTVIDAPTDATPPDCNCADAPPDAPPIDGPPSSVMVVTCPGDPGMIASEVTTPGFSFAVSVPTVPTGSIVRFQLNASHNAASGTPAAPTDLFTVPFGGQAVCLQFTAPGNFPFYCEPHQFTGSLTVADAT